MKKFLAPLMCAFLLTSCAQDSSNNESKASNPSTPSGTNANRPAINPEMMDRDLDIVDTAIAAGSFETLTAAVVAVGLEATLRSEGPFTVLAPNDEAFAKLPVGTVEALLNNIPALTNILLYHVAAGAVLSGDVLKLNEILTVQGTVVKVEQRMDGLFINDSKVIATDIVTSNGVIHVIDSVLIPSL